MGEGGEEVVLDAVQPLGLEAGGPLGLVELGALEGEGARIGEGLQEGEVLGVEAADFAEAEAEASDDAPLHEEGERGDGLGARAFANRGQVGIDALSDARRDSSTTGRPSRTASAMGSGESMLMAAPRSATPGG